MDDPEAKQRGTPTAVSDHPGVNALSNRELEVVRLVARGLTDKQIADELVISPRTAQSHVASALRKTGTSRRTQLAALVIHEGLVTAPAAPAPRPRRPLA